MKKNIIAILAVTVMFVMTGVATAANDESGIKGKISYSALCRANRSGTKIRCKKAPYQGAVSVRSSDGATEMAQFSTSSNGKFEIVLDPGVYRLIPLDPAASKLKVFPQTITVNDNDVTKTTILLNGPIRF